ncbi:MAG: diacylglycerol kinase family lipid kinase [Sediminibacterium sp.]|nr:diacylglycerol kinase family lipid kinase [Sediminibacterium sp.]MBX9780613.1 diacylglycerol kinase family lipid kinase [Chitinophagaceae bacterium]
MQRKIIYLYNPISGTSKKDSFLKLIEKETKYQEIPYCLYTTNAAGNYDELKDIIEYEHYTDVVMMGGDGTINKATQELRSTGVQFGILPVGSGNGLARAAGIPVKLKSALALIFSGTAKPIDAFMLNNQYACMLSGIGFDAQVAHGFANKATRGLLTYTQQSIINYFKAHPYQFEIEIDAFNFFTEAFFISIANSNQFGNNFTIAPEASLSDGLLDIVIVQKMNKAKLPFALLKQIRGNNKLQELVDDLGSKNILYFQTSSLKIKNLKLAPLHLDGDPAETMEEINIRIIPNAFQLICP